MRSTVSASPGHAAQPREPRELAPDLARGFMLLFIALANVVWFVHGWPDRPGHQPPGNLADAVTQFLTIVAIDGRSYPMFAFLFGYGMVGFQRSRLAHGLSDKAVRVMLIRRHWALTGFGVVHCLLLFDGDVLAGYGLTGLVLMALLHQRRDRTVLAWVVVLMGVQLLIAAAGARLFGGAWYPNPAADPGYLDSLLQRGSRLVLLPVQVVVSSFAPMILLGWLAARRRLLEDAGRHRRLLRTAAVAGVGVAWLAASPAAAEQVGLVDLGNNAAPLASVAHALGFLGGLGYISVFGLVAARIGDRPGPLPRLVAAVGERSLSSYLLQSVVFAPLLSAWGLGLGRELGAFPAALVAIGTWLVSLALCGWLASRGRRGPAEHLLRNLTYGAYA